MIGASAATEQARELADLGHGILTYSLLAGLGAVEGGPLRERPIRPQDSDQVVDVMEWFSYAASHVPRLTREYFAAAQNAQMWNQQETFPVLPLVGN